VHERYSSIEVDMQCRRKRELELKEVLRIILEFKIFGGMYSQKKCTISWYSCRHEEGILGTLVLINITFCFYFHHS
jgi:hypothetical protein